MSAALRVGNHYRVASDYTFAGQPMHGRIVLVEEIIDAQQPEGLLVDTRVLDGAYTDNSPAYGMRVPMWVSELVELDGAGV